MHRAIALLLVLSLAVQGAPIQEALDADAVVPEDPTSQPNNTPESELVAFGDLFDPAKWGADLGLSPSSPPPPCNIGDCCDVIESKVHLKTDMAIQSLPPIAQAMAREGIEEGIRNEMKRTGIKQCKDYKKEGKCKDKAAVAGCAETCGVCKQAADLKTDDSKEIKAMSGDIKSVDERITDVALAAKRKTDGTEEAAKETAVTLKKQAKSLEQKAQSLKKEATKAVKGVKNVLSSKKDEKAVEKQGVKIQKQSKEEVAVAAKAAHKAIQTAQNVAEGENKEDQKDEKTVEKVLKMIPQNKEEQSKKEEEQSDKKEEDDMVTVETAASQKAADATDTKDAADSAKWADEAIKAAQDAAASLKTEKKKKTPAPVQAPRVGPATLPRGDGRPAFVLPPARL